MAEPTIKVVSTSKDGIHRQVIETGFGIDGKKYTQTYHQTLINGKWCKGNFQKLSEGLANLKLTPLELNRMFLDGGFRK